MTSGPPETVTAIPRLDLALARDTATEAQLQAQLRYAITNVGFLYIENHGVPDSVIGQVVDALPALFALPPSAKDEVSLGRSPHFLGYSGDGAEVTAGKADRREQFEFATELTRTWEQGQDMPLYERLRGPNPWPSVFPQLRPVIECYIKEMTDLGERFLRLVAKALSLPAEKFLSFLSDQHRLKLVRYPALPDSEEHRLGVGPHKDSSGWWTFLLQASPPHVEGLQVLNKAGEWVHVPNIPGTFVVNIGQAFEVVTNGVCKATTHRVLGGSLERFSVPFFQGVRWDLTKEEAVGTLATHFSGAQFHKGSPAESDEASKVDSSFLKGKCDTWGESQLRTKIRSHQDVGKAFYGPVFHKYLSDG